MAEGKISVRVTVLVNLESKPGHRVYDSEAYDLVANALEKRKEVEGDAARTFSFLGYEMQGYENEETYQRERFDRSTYYDQVKAVAKEAIDTVLSSNDWSREKPHEIDFDTLRDEVDTNVHETIDGHQWIIYTSYALKVLECSDNDGAYGNEIGFQGDELKDGLEALHSRLAFFAMRRDVMEAAEEQIKELEEAAEDYEEPEEVEETDAAPAE